MADHGKNDNSMKFISCIILTGREDMVRLPLIDTAV